MKQYMKKHLWARITAWILSITALLLIGVLLFLCLWPSFGGRVNAEDAAEYELRADNYINGEFINIEEFAIGGNYVDPYADRTSGKGEEPEDEIPVLEPTLIDNPTVEDLTVTWLGHSSSLVQIQGKNVLFDPVFSDVASPVSFVGVFRFSAVAMTAEALPNIDICIISHDHYDHLDYPTIKAIDSKVAMYVVPLGVEKHLERWGIDSGKIKTMAWWEDFESDGLTIACAPSRHYSGRSLTDSNATLWGSWVLRGEYYSLFESGDSGYGDHFTEIADRYGPFDIALLDTAQYDGAWHEVHMFPEEAVQAGIELNATYLMPIHWGAFKLANHPWDDPAERFSLYAEEQNVTAVTPRIGETVSIENVQEYQHRWWRDYK